MDDLAVIQDTFGSVAGDRQHGNFELLIKMCEAQIVRLDGPGKVAKLEERIDSMKHARTLKKYTMFSEKEEERDEKLLNQKKRKLAQSSFTEKKHKSSPFK